MNRTVAMAAGAVLLACATAGLLVFFPERPLFAMAPLLGALLVFAVVRLPLRSSVLCFVATVLLIHTSNERPADGMWMSPLDELGVLLSHNLNALTGAPFVSFSVLDVMACLLLAVAYHRRRLGDGLGRAHRMALLGFIGAFVAMALHGFLRGGDVNAMYWQVRYLVYFPVIAALSAAALKSDEDYEWLGRAVVWTALVKAAFGCFFYFAIALPRGWSPHYVTTHSDSIHFVLAVAVLAIRWFEAPRKEHLRRLLVIAPIILLAMVLNDRRLGWIGLLGAAAVVFVNAPKTQAKRRVARLFVAMLPLLALYSAAGWGSKARVFAPVQTLRSVVATDEDSSTKWREFENYNLAATLRRAPLAGQGLGLPYDEVVHLPSIESQFSLYRHIPHNSLLWLLSVGGVFGLVAVLWPLWLASYSAARTLRSSADKAARMRAQLVLCAVFVGMAQAFGDMGLHSLSNLTFLAVSASAAFSLALRTSSADEALPAAPAPVALAEPTRAPVA